MGWNSPRTAIPPLSGPNGRTGSRTVSAKTCGCGARADNSITPLTATGHDSDPHFSPDGNYIAFLSDRPVIADEEAAKDAVERVWIMPAHGGGAFPLYQEPLSVDAFTWSGDGKAIFVATEQPISEDAKTAEKKAWKDTVRWREQRRGEDILRVPLAAAIPQPKLLMASASEPKAGCR